MCDLKNGTYELKTMWLTTLSGVKCVFLYVMGCVRVYDDVCGCVIYVVAD